MIKLPVKETGQGYSEGLYYKVRDANGDFVCATDKEHAPLIVKALNDQQPCQQAGEELVKELNHIRCEILPYGRHPTIKEIQKAMKTCRQAIARIKELEDDRNYEKWHYQLRVRTKTREELIETVESLLECVKTGKADIVENQIKRRRGKRK